MRNLLGLVLGMSMASNGFAANCPEQAEDKVEYSNAWPYDLSIGAEKVGVEVNAELGLMARCDLAMVDVAAKAKVKAFDSVLSLSDASVNAFWKAGVSQVESKVMVLGYELFNDLRNAEGDVNLIATPRYEIDRDGDYTVTVGPVAIPIRYGVVGFAGLEANANLTDAQLSSNVMPAAKAELYAQVEAQLADAKASVGGEMLLLDNQFTGNGGLGIEQNGESLLVNIKALVANDVTAVDGGFVAKVTLGEDQDPVIEQSLFNWEGYNRKDEVVNYEDVLTL